MEKVAGVTSVAGVKKFPTDVKIPVYIVLNVAEIKKKFFFTLMGITHFWCKYLCAKQPLV